MIYYRRKLGAAFVKVIGEGQGFLGADSEERIGDNVYAVFLVAAIIISVLIWMNVSQEHYQVYLSITWGIFIGWALLLYSDAKIAVTIFGGFSGVGIADLAGIADGLEGTKKTLERIGEALSTESLTVEIMPIAYVIFFIIVLLFCFKAYSRLEEK